MTKAIRGLVLIDEPLQLLAGIDTQIEVFVAGFTQIEKINSSKLRMILFKKKSKKKCLPKARRMRYRAPPGASIRSTSVIPPPLTRRRASNLKSPVFSGGGVLWLLRL